MSAEITSGDLDQFKQDLQATPGANALQKAVMNNGINATAENTDSKVAMTPTFSIELDTGAVSNQKQSGRCWMFAALNTMRHGIQAQFKIKDFELSQNYTFFWDKFEKSNYFYENVLKPPINHSTAVKLPFFWLPRNKMAANGICCQP